MSTNYKPVILNVLVKNAYKNNDIQYLGTWICWLAPMRSWMKPSQRLIIWIVKWNLNESKTN